MQLVFKVGNKKPALDLAERAKYWRDGQLVDIYPDGHPLGKMVPKHFCVIQTPHDYWALRGTTDWKSTIAKVYELKKFLSPVDSNGKYCWEAGYLEAEKRIRLRDWFVDYKWMLDQGWISKADFESIYNQDKEHNKVFIDRDLSSYLVHEDAKTRMVSEFSDRAGSIASGTYQIGTGAGADYATVTLFEADIAAQLTGNLTGEHQNEETAISSVVAFDTDTNTHLLKLTAESGAEHNGGAYGNGARVNHGTSDYLAIDETGAGELAKFEISKLAINMAGSGNKGFSGINGGDTSLVINRLLVKGDANTSDQGIYTAVGAGNNVLVTNNIVYGLTNDHGIYISSGSNATQQIYNNTSIGNKRNFRNVAESSATVSIKNNLAQAATDVDYYNLSNVDNSAKNVSEDATSPDAAYQSKDVHTNSVFKDYANDDYRLDSGGDATNLAILDDGDDLSGTFADDIEGQTRSTWYIGASEIVAAGGISMPVVMLQMDHFDGGAML